VKSFERKSRSSLANCRRRPLQSGQALIELALVVPMLMVLALGVIEIGRYAYIAILVGNAARAATAYGAQSLPQSADTVGITAAAVADFQSNGQDATKLQVPSSNQITTCGCDNAGAVVTANCDPQVNPSAGTCTGGAHWVVTLSVTASGTWDSLFGYPGLPTTITVSRTSSMRVAQN
jgi:Flp pilus assembly protein TadG